MSFKVWGALLILLFSCTFGYSYDCSNVTEVEREGSLDYVANVTFPVPDDFEGRWMLELDTDAQFESLGGWAVWVAQIDAEAGNATLRSREAVNMTEGDMISFRFNLSWFREEPMPMVISMVWNGVQICEDDGKTVDEIKNERRRRRRGSNDNDSRAYRFITDRGRLIYRRG